MIRYEVVGRVAVITLDRPEARNAIDVDMALQLEAAIDRLEGDDDTWVGVLTATVTEPRPVFCAGADLKMVQRRQGAAETNRGGFAGVTFRERAKPLIAAVDGLATAGGCEIVLACDLVIASTRASFGLAEVKRNLVAGAGGLFRLARQVGRSTAMEAALTGNPLSAQRAYELGLVGRLVEPHELQSTAMTIAEEICANAPVAVRESRRIVLAAETEDDATLRAMGDAALAKVYDSDDLREGLAAFVEKRPPVWTGR